MSGRSEVDVYIAAPFNRKDDVRAARAVLKRKGYGVNVRWLLAPGEANFAQLHGEATVDLQDIERSDMIVLLNDGVHFSTTGAMHFECGYAVALAKKLVIVGQRTPGNPFHTMFECYSRVEDIPDVGSIF